MAAATERGIEGNYRALRFCVAFVGVAAMLTGCSDGNSSKTESSGATKQSVIELSSPILTKDGMIPDGFTCRPKSIWLPLRWEEVPGSASELVLYGSRVRHEDVGRSGVATLVSAIVIGGLQPSRRGLAAGSLPDGTFVVTFQPEAFCLRPKAREELTFQLYAQATDQRLDRSALGFEEILKRFDQALAVGSLFTPFKSSVEGSA